MEIKYKVVLLHQAKRKDMKNPNIDNSVKVLSSIPTGWVETKGCSNCPKGFMFISNNKSRFKPGREIALIKI